VQKDKSISLILLYYKGMSWKIRKFKGRTLPLLLSTQTYNTTHSFPLKLYWLLYIEGCFLCILFEKWLKILEHFSVFQWFLKIKKKMFSKSSVKSSLCVLGYMAKKQARPLTQSKIWPWNFSFNYSTSKVNSSLILACSWDEILSQMGFWG